jgi:hypothetical protein
MNFHALDRLAALRERLGAAASTGGRPLQPGRTPASLHARVDLIVTVCEVIDRHGTGVLLRRIFGEGRDMVTVRSRDFYGGDQQFGVARFIFEHGEAPRPEVYATLLKALGGLPVSRILCVPYKLDDVRTALAAHDLFGAPLCTWVMDDQNIEAGDIPDGPLDELFTRSAVRLAISPELRQAYQAKFRKTFALAPPAVGASFLQTSPTPPDPARLEGRCGLLFGNIWGERWLDDLMKTLSGSGIQVDWHHGAGTPWITIDEAHLTRAGITSRPFLPESELVAKLRASPFVLVPSGTFEGADSHRFVARLSLPSRLPYVAATAGTPVLVLGDPETAAARFVTRHDLGVVVPYQQAAVVAAVEAICRPEAQARHRAAAATLAPALSSKDMASWIWRSLEAGRPIDHRFDALEPHP